MKRFFTTIVASAIAATTLFAQNTEPDKMVVKMKNGTTTTYVINDIDCITFEGTEQPPVEKKTWKIDLNNTFSDGYVQKVMDGDTQVAEMCSEYVRYKHGDDVIVDGKLVVVYPMGTDGKADLSKGVAANGAKLSWDVASNALVSYTAPAEDAELKTVYLTSDGKFVSAAEAADAVETTQEAYVVKDKRGVLDSSPFTYHVVKVGTQYWLEENLRATLFRDGTSITKYTSNQAAAWDANTTGAYKVYADDMQYCWIDYGALYNGYAVLSDRGLAPEGWEVTTVAQWNALKSYLATGQSTKVKSAEYWTKVGTNITGLNIMPGGYYNKAMSDSAEGNDVYYWNTDKLKDDIFGTDALGTTRIQNSIVTTGKHGYGFGHYVRCIRK